MEKDTNKALIPSYTVNTDTDYYGANRESSWPEMSYSGLKKITYPTGGNTQFNFEPNTIWGDFTYIADTQRAISNIGPYIGVTTTQTINITTSSNPYKFVLDFHTVPYSTSVGTASCAGVTVDKNNPHKNLF
ncbi:MAG: hypothetical protein IPP73_11590 [Chitinophagaceae bacterium]|nr:hypothetical protein [Chitinophagaceae bacterium]